MAREKIPERSGVGSSGEDLVDSAVDFARIMGEEIERSRRENPVRRPRTIFDLTLGAIVEPVGG